MAASLLILDLDHTLFDPESIPYQAFAPAFERLREANRRMRGVSEEVMDASLPELMGSPISEVARRRGWPEALRRAALELSGTAVLPTSLPLYPDVEAIVRLPVRKILVTTGVPSVQLQKVEALGLRAWLDGVHVDDALALPRTGKRAVFAAVLEEERVPPGEAVAVGDRLESEIAAGAALGMRTVHVARAGCPGPCPATHCMPDLRGLGAVLGGGDGSAACP